MCLPLLCGGAPPGGAPHQTKPSKPNSSSGGGGGGTCIAKSDSYYVRNRCEGFLTVNKDRRVLIQKEGLNISHPAAEIVKETCSETVGRQVVRYRHQLSNTYICFNKKGMVKAVDARRVDGKGTLCMFEEEAVEAVETVDSATYHTLRSVHNSRWYLGISSKDNHQAVADEAPGGERRRRPPRTAATARRLVRPPSDFCGSHFSSGRHGPPPPSKAFRGVFDLVSDFMMDGSGGGRQNKNNNHRVNLKNTLAATKSDSSSSSSRSSSYSSVNSESTVLQSPSLRLQPDKVGAGSEERAHDNDEDNDDIADNNNSNETKISKAHLEALRMQHQLTAQRHRIRHAKHKRPRPSREEKARARKLQQIAAASPHTTIAPDV